MDQLPRLGKRELICLLLFTCNYVVLVRRGFLFLWVLGMGYVIQGSRGRRIRRPGTKKIGLGRMVLLRDYSTDARFFRREVSGNIGFDVY